MSEVNWITHCSHKEHSLKEVFSNAEFKCKVCYEIGTGARYQCDPCDFNAHPSCAMLPEFITSFTHPQHQLTLKPVSFIHGCRLCKGLRTSIMYRCEAEDCRFFLHPTCSLIPQMVQNHPKHPIHSVTIRPINSKKKCDVCEKKCKHWAYNCEACQIYIHPKCKVKKVDADNSKNDESLGRRIAGAVVDTIVGVTVGIATS